MSQVDGELWLESRCEHGYLEQHRRQPNNYGQECPGGTRRRVALNLQAAAAKYVEWDGWFADHPPGLEAIDERGGGVNDLGIFSEPVDVAKGGVT